MTTTTSRTAPPNDWSPRRQRPPVDPARPGPGPTPLALLRALDLSIARRVVGLLPGDYRARQRGGGTELAAIRPYEPGDDVRRIDWNVTARTMQPHVRIHIPERGLTTWLLLDVSPSMAFGTADRRKADVAEGVALAFGHLGTRRSNTLGVLTFGAGDDRRLAPTTRRDLVLGLLGQLRTTVPREPVGATSPASALRLVGRSARPGGLIVLVSDLRGARGWLSELLAATARHQVLAVEVRDPREEILPAIGELSLIDPETGRQLRVDVTDRLARRYQTAAADERAALASELRRLRIDHLVVSTRGDWLRSLATQLRTRRAAA